MSEMTLNEYQKETLKTRVYFPKDNVVYPILALAGEVGEVCNKVKKIIRDNQGVVPGSGSLRDDIILELGDALWYMANLADDLGATLEDVARNNLLKLKARKARGTIHGSGDDR